MNFVSKTSRHLPHHAEPCGAFKLGIELMDLLFGALLIREVENEIDAFAAIVGHDGASDQDRNTMPVLMKELLFPRSIDAVLEKSQQRGFIVPSPLVRGQGIGHQRQVRRLETGDSQE